MVDEHVAMLSVSAARVRFLVQSPDPGIFGTSPSLMAALVASIRECGASVLGVVLIVAILHRLSWN